MRKILTEALYSLKNWLILVLSIALVNAMLTKETKAFKVQARADSVMVVHLLEDKKRDAAAFALRRALLGHDLTLTPTADGEEFSRLVRKSGGGTHALHP